MSHFCIIQRPCQRDVQSLLQADSPGLVLIVALPPFVSRALMQTFGRVCECNSYVNDGRSSLCSDVSEASWRCEGCLQRYQRAALRCVRVVSKCRPTLGSYSYCFPLSATAWVHRPRRNRARNDSNPPWCLCQGSYSCFCAAFLLVCTYASFSLPNH